MPSPADYRLTAYPTLQEELARLLLTRPRNNRAGFSLFDPRRPSSGFGAKEAVDLNSTSNGRISNEFRTPTEAANSSFLYNQYRANIVPAEAVYYGFPTGTREVARKFDQPPSPEGRDSIGLPQELYDAYNAATPKLYQMSRRGALTQFLDGYEPTPQRVPASLPPAPPLSLDQIFTRFD